MEVLVDQRRVCSLCLCDFDEDEHAPWQLPCLHLMCRACVHDPGVQQRACFFAYDQLLTRCNAPFTTAEAEPQPPPQPPASAEADGDAWAAAAVAPDCDVCEPETDTGRTHAAVARCPACDEHMCKTQADAHSRHRKYKDHVLVLLRVPGGAEGRCRDHGSDAFAFCVTQGCHVPVCNDCVLAKHCGHELLRLSEALDSLVQQVRTKVGGMRERVTVLRGNLDAFVHMKKVVGEWRDDARLSVREAFNTLIRELHAVIVRLERRRDQLVRDAGGVGLAQLKNAHEGHDTLYMAVQHMAELDDAFNELVQRSQTPAAVALPRNIQSALRLLARLNSVLDKTYPSAPAAATAHTLVLARPADLLTTEIEELGALRAVRRPLKPRDYTRMGSDVPAWTIGASTPAPGKCLGDFEQPIGVAVMHTAEGVPQLVVGDQLNKRLQLFDLDRNPLRLVPMEDFVYGLATTDAPDQVWVAMYNTGVRQVNVRTLTTIREIVCPKAHGVLVLPSGDLVVSLYVDNSVVCITPSNTVRWRSADNFKYAMGMAFIPDRDEILVCDRNSSRVQVLSAADGRGVRILPAPNMPTQAQMSQPSGVAYDQFACTVIVTEEKSISAWTPEGELVHRWAPAAFNNGYGACCLTPDCTMLFAVDHSRHRVVGQ